MKISELAPPIKRVRGTDFDIADMLMGVMREGDEGDRDPGKGPENPLDEPEPPRVDDPPAQPDSKGPYVVEPGQVRGGKGNGRTKR